MSVLPFPIVTCSVLPVWDIWFFDTVIQKWRYFLRMNESLRLPSRKWTYGSTVEPESWGLLRWVPRSPCVSVTSVPLDIFKFIRDNQQLGSLRWEAHSVESLPCGSKTANYWSTTQTKGVRRLPTAQPGRTAAEFSSEDLIL